MMKKIVIFLAVLLLLAGAGVYFYPSAADLFYQTGAAVKIGRYQKNTESANAAEMDEMIEKAQDYNAAFSETLSTDPFQTGNQEPYQEDGEYQNLLNLDGLMGYVDIPKIDVYLPVYHGTSQETLKKGAGHLYGSALPVGGNGTHSVISAHRGLPSAKMFTDLDQVQKGDIFYFHVLNRILAYQVDQIEVVEPTELSFLNPEPGKDYMTLFTCTPYGINTERLLVRGVRIPLDVVGMDKASERAGADAPKLKASLPPAMITAASAAAVILLLTVILFVWLHGRKRGRGEERQENL